MNDKNMADKTTTVPTKGTTGSDAVDLDKLNEICADWKSGTFSGQEAMIAVAALIAQARAAAPNYKPWYDAVTDACIVSGELPWDENDARGSLERLIAWREQIALDPAVSAAAAKLVESGRAAAPAANAQTANLRKALELARTELIRCIAYPHVVEQVDAALSQQPVQAAGDDFTAHSPDCRNYGCTGCADPAELSRLLAPVIAAPTAPSELTPLDYRAQGREEVLAIILGQSSEDPFADCIGWGRSGAPEDEGGTYWKEDKLRELLHICDHKHDAYDRMEAAYWEALGRSDEAKREMLFVQQAPFYEPLHEFLEKHGAWDLIADLKRVAPTATSEPVATDLTCEKLAQLLAGKHVNDYGYRMLLNGEEIGFNLQDLLDIVKLAAPAPQQAAPLTDARIAEMIRRNTRYEIEQDLIDLCRDVEHELSAGSAASAGDARDAALFRLVVEKRISLYFEGQGEDEAVWVDEMMKWSDGDRLNATRALIDEVAKQRATMAATKEEKQ